MRNVLVSTILLGMLTACGGGPPPPPPTLVSVVITADPRSNDGAPLSLRVYQLASPAGFEGAQFFPLFNGDAAALKDDLIKRDDVLLAPGQSKTLALTPTDRTKAIGVLGAYKNYETLTWRTLTPVPPHESSVLTVASSTAGLSASIAPAK
jgi:type VI secretion system protein VasD